MRSSDSPAAIMVAIWRLMIARSLSLTPLPNPPMLISRFRPVPAWARVDRDRGQPMVRRRDDDGGLALGLHLALDELARGVPARVRERLRCRRHQYAPPGVGVAEVRSRSG